MHRGALKGRDSARDRSADVDFVSEAGLVVLQVQRWMSLLHVFNRWEQCVERENFIDANLVHVAPVRGSTSP